MRSLRTIGPALGSLMALVSCGRTPWIYDDASGGASAGDDVGDDVGDVDDDGDSVDDGDPTPPPMPPPSLDCPGPDRLFEGFEDEAAGWDLHARWSPILHAEAPEGDWVLWGHWDDFDVGCPVSADAALRVDLDLSTATEAQLHFEHVGEACALDTLRVEIRAEPGGEPTFLLEPVPVGDQWTHYAQDLSPWAGLPSVQLTLGFDNVCGDSCGVNWRIDALRVCTDA